jgi:hypothetical protein
MMYPLLSTSNHQLIYLSWRREERSDAHHNRLFQRLSGRAAHLPTYRSQLHALGVPKMVGFHVPRLHGVAGAHARGQDGPRCCLGRVRLRLGPNSLNAQGKFRQVERDAFLLRERGEAGVHDYGAVRVVRRVCLRKNLSAPSDHAVDGEEKDESHLCCFSSSGASQLLICTSSLGSCRPV